MIFIIIIIIIIIIMMIVIIIIIIIITYNVSMLWFQDYRFHVLHGFISS